MIKKRFQKVKKYIAKFKRLKKTQNDKKRYNNRGDSLWLNSIWIDIFNVSYYGLCLFCSSLLYFSTKANITDLRGNFSDMKASLIQWMVGTMIACTGLAATIAFGLSKLLKGQNHKESFSLISVVYKRQ